MSARIFDKKNEVSMVLIGSADDRRAHRVPAAVLRRGCDGGWISAGGGKTTASAADGVRCREEPGNAPRPELARPQRLSRSTDRRRPLFPRPGAHVPARIPWVA